MSSQRYFELSSGEKCGRCTDGKSSLLFATTLSFVLCPSMILAKLGIVRWESWTVWGFKNCLRPTGKHSFRMERKV